MLKNINLKASGAWFIAITGALLFSTKAIFVKLAFQHTHVSALHLLVLRMLFSMPFYVFAGLYSHQKATQKITQKQWLLIAIMGLLGYYLSSLFDFIGLQYVSAGLERLILFLYPTFTVLINTFILKTRLKRIQIIALILTYLGIGIAFLGEVQIDTSNAYFYYGAFMVFLCAITYSIYLSGSGKLVPIIGPTPYTAYVMLFATGGVFLHFLLTAHTTTHAFFEPNLVLYGIALAIVATVLPSFLLNIGMKKVGSNNIAIITSIGPVSTILQAHFFLNEPILMLQILGTLLVIIGVLLTGLKNSM